MTWTPNATVSIDGVEFRDSSLNGLSVSAGRSSVWEQPRAGYCSIQIVILPGDHFDFAINDSIVITVEDSSGDPVTLFTGTLTTVTSNVAASGSIENVVISTVTGIGSMAKMSRVITGGTSWPKEYDDDRINRILTASGVAIDTIDTPGVYEFEAITKDLGDTYTYAAYYAQMAFGYIYETATGSVGYANESRRTQDVGISGYYHIPKDVILGRSVSSQVSLGDLLNDLTLGYRAGTVTSTSASSIATYGKAGASIDTELHDLAQAQVQADRYITLRAIPQINLNAFTVQLDASTITNATRDLLLSIYMGLPIQIQNLPAGVLGSTGGTFNGFVESYQFSIAQKQAAVTINASDSTYSLAPTRWQDVNPSLIWSAVDPTLQWQNYE